MPRNILNLSSYEIDHVDEDDHDYHIYAETKRIPDCCPHCSSNSLVSFGRREQLVKDLPMHGKRVGIYINTRRMKCNSCTRTFSEELPSVDANRAMTRRLLKWIGEQSVKRTFTSIAEEVGTSEGTIRQVFRECINKLEQEIRFETPKWMGIDEIHIIKKPRCIISNIEHNTAVEVLNDRTKKTVMNYFQRLQGRDKVRYVAMDMWRTYKDSVSVLMPNATIVVDKFHVVRMANDALEKIRKDQRSVLDKKQLRGLMHDRFVLLKRRHDLDQKEAFKLDGWSSNYPTLGAAYDAKEAFYGIWDLDTRAEAENAYEIWKNGLPSEIRPAYHDLIRAVDNWHEHVFSYWDHPVTNAYTESLNNLIRVMNRLGRGYSFEALRAKILFTQGTHKTKKPSFNRRTRRPPNAVVMEKSMMMDYSILNMERSTPDDQREKNYGADISTLADLIERDML